MNLKNNIVKQLFCSLFITATIIGCSIKRSSDSEEKSIPSSIDEASGRGDLLDTTVSYAGLKLLLDSKQAIPVNYLVSNSELSPNKALYEHQIAQEAKNYIIIHARDDGMDAKNYFLLSFSKESGRLISFIGLGQEAEGVDPYKTEWRSATTFSTIDYHYELEEDEESGAYIKGALQDSTVQNFRVDSAGFISPLE